MVISTRDALEFQPDGLQSNGYSQKESEGNFRLRGGIEYIQKGAKLKSESGSDGLNYLEIPITAQYRSIIAQGYIHWGPGPYFAYGVGGKAFGVSSFGENNGGYKCFDDGLNFLLGYKSAIGISLDFTTISVLLTLYIPHLM